MGGEAGTAGCTASSMPLKQAEAGKQPLPAFGAPVGHAWLPFHISVAVAGPSLQEAPQRRCEHRRHLRSRPGSGARGGGVSQGVHSWRDACPPMPTPPGPPIHLKPRSHRHNAAHLCWVGGELEVRRNDANHRGHRQQVLGEEGRQAGHHMDGRWVQPQLLLHRAVQGRQAVEPSTGSTGSTDGHLSATRLCWRCLQG